MPWPSGGLPTRNFLSCLLGLSTRSFLSFSSASISGLICLERLSVASGSMFESLVRRRLIFPSSTLLCLSRWRHRGLTMRQSGSTWRSFPGQAIKVGVGSHVLEEVLLYPSRAHAAGDLFRRHVVMGTDDRWLAVIARPVTDLAHPNFVKKSHWLQRRRVHGPPTAVADPPRRRTCIPIDRVDVPSDFDVSLPPGTAWRSRGIP